MPNLETGCRTMDFLWTLLFVLWVEALSLPLRWALAGWRAPVDVRRMLSRLAGPPLLALPIWFLAHAGGHFLDRPIGLIWIGLAISLGLLAGLSQTRSAARLMAYEGSAWREGALDLLMAGLLLGFVAFRRWVPEMTAYTLDSSAAEKFANAMIFWSSWHARSLPPQDYWLAGNTLQYYYWGHFQWAWLARMGGFPAALAINLAFAVAVTLTWTAAYLLGRAARLPRGWAAGVAILAAWGGNPAAIKELSQLWGSWHQFGGNFPWGSYGFWGPSRAIPNVVDEFPAFSAILGDFHSHHLALPWLTGWLALSIAGRRWRGECKGTLTQITWGLAWGALGLAAVLTNLWNLPLVGLGIGIMLLLALFGFFMRSRRGKNQFQISDFKFQIDHPRSEGRNPQSGEADEDVRAPDNPQSAFRIPHSAFARQLVYTLFIGLALLGGDAPAARRGAPAAPHHGSAWPAGPPADSQTSARTALAAGESIRYVGPAGAGAGAGRGGQLPARVAEKKKKSVG